MKINRLIKGCCQRSRVLRLVMLTLWLVMSVLLLAFVLLQQYDISRWLASNPLLNQPLLFFGIFVYILIGWWLFQLGTAHGEDDTHHPAAR